MDKVLQEGKFVGVVPPVAFGNLKFPKKLLLMFDGLAIGINGQLSTFEERIIENMKGELSWLIGEGYLTVLSGSITQDSPERSENRVGLQNTFFLTNQIAKDFQRVLKPTGHIQIVPAQSVRETANDLRKKGIDAVFIAVNSEINSEAGENVDLVADREAVVRITLK